MDVLGEEGLQRLLSLDLGDLLGVDGAVLRSRHGELTLRVDAYQVLAKALRPPPDKHHGLSDVETRYRRRELDLIASEEARARLHRPRADHLRRSRYLDGQGFIEVETPVLQPLYGGALARPFTTHHNALDRDLYLRIATELYLKRLIVGGLERVYELGKDFRNEGISPRHNPEFTMVEWYEAYADYEDEARRLEEVVRAAAGAVDYAGELDFQSPWRRVGLLRGARPGHGHRAGGAARRARAGRRHRTGRPAAADGGSGMARDRRRPVLQSTPSRRCASRRSCSTIRSSSRRWPASTATEPGLVERWEAFAGGVEIANAFSELIDPDVQRARFSTSSASQRRRGLRREALRRGCSSRRSSRACRPRGGVGLGIDRLVMLLTGRDSIREVVLFPAMRD